jgi:tetratricopeptide (TPR) repeat protein
MIAHCDRQNLSRHTSCCGVMLTIHLIMSYRIPYLITAIVVFLHWASGSSPALASNGGEVSVTFSVDVTYVMQGIPARVYVRGDRQELGAWDGPGVELDLREQNGRVVYSASVTLMEASGAVEYKFVIERQGEPEEWEAGANRVLELVPGVEPPPSVLFSDVERPGLRRAVTVDVSVEPGPLGEIADAIRIMGSRRPLSWDLADEPLNLVPSTGGPWEGSIRFPAGTQRDVAFKLAYLVDGRWIWEALPCHINHAFLLNDEADAQYVVLRYDEATGRLAGATTGRPGDVAYLNDYASLERELGQGGPRSPYGYYHAVQLLEQGAFEASRAAYEAWRALRPDHPEVGEYSALLAAALAETGRTDEALAYLAEEETREQGYRRAYLSYARGEILLNAGRAEDAAQALQGVLALYSDEPDVAAYARYALATSLLQLERQDEAATELSLVQGEMRAAALRTLAHVERERGNRAASLSALEALGSLGTEEERLRAELDYVRLAMAPERPSPTAYEEDVELPEVTSEADLDALRAALRRRNAAVEARRETQDVREVVDYSDRLASISGRAATLETRAGERIAQEALMLQAIVHEEAGRSGRATEAYERVIERDAVPGLRRAAEARLNNLSQQAAEVEE